MDDLREHIRKLREDFSRGALSESDADPDPAKQFSKWMAQAVEARVPEVQAMTLCTATREGRPSGRVVYLREFGDHEYWFYTNYQSRKGLELDLNPQAAVSFFWPQLERQIRIEGTVRRCGDDRSDAYFNLRPYDSKLGAWASSQSAPLKSRQSLEAEVERFRKEYAPDAIRRPPHWGGYILTADYYEFWQGRPSRLHDRLCYRLHVESWKLVRLAP